MRLEFRSEKLRYGDQPVTLRSEPYEVDLQKGKFLIVPELTFGQKDGQWDRIGFDILLHDIPEGFAINIEEDESVVWHPRMDDVDVTVNPFWSEDRIYVAIKPAFDDMAFGEGVYELLGIEFWYDPGTNILRFKIVPLT